MNRLARGADGAERYHLAAVSTTLLIRSSAVKRIWFGLATSLLVLAWFALPSTAQETPPSNPLVVRFLDVGQGDGAWLTTPGGQTILIDCGPFSYGPKLVARLGEAGVQKVDVVAPSHAHADHMGGCTHVLSSFPVGEVLWTGQTDTSATWRNFWALVESSATPVTRLVVGQVFDWGGVQTTVYNPRDHSDGTPIDEYEDSHVLLVEHGAVRLLFTGDLHSRGEAMALAAGLSQAQILKVAEHGSRSGSGQVFLQAVAPQVAVISAGAGNTYGHPHPEVLARLASVGAQTLVTADVGTITINSNSATYSVTAERGEPAAGGESAGSEAAAQPPAPEPSQEPAAVPSSGQAQPISEYDCPASHPIKGNVSSSGERIYHVPGGAFYARTKPEECFATEQDAQAAGYRKSQR
jgi:competence protein ComEC